jgi:LacI family transcriptional regulator
MPPSPSPPTLQDLADHCRVSKWTVAAALRQDPRVKPATAAQICAAARALNYDPTHNQAARRLAARKTGSHVRNQVVAALVPTDFLERVYFTNLLRGILQVLSPAHFALLTLESEHLHASPTAELPAILTRGEVDGVITVGLTKGLEPLLARLQTTPGCQGRPIVSTIWPLLNMPSVRIDDEQVGYLGASHLLAHGHQHLLHFIFLTHPDDPEVHRLAGVRRALVEYGLDPARHLHLHQLQGIWLDPTPLSALSPAQQNGHAQEEQLLLHTLQTHPEITALIALNDASAIHAWFTLERHGWDVPGRMSLLGCDDTDAKLDEHEHNVLSTIRLPLVDLGAAAAHLLLALLEDPTTPASSSMLPPSLIARASTGPASLV